MRILVDTNVLLDVVLKREPFCTFSQAILTACQQELLTGTITTQALADMFYILRKDFSIEERRALLLSFCEIFYISGVDRDMIVSALENESFDDLEDCLQAECAVTFTADYIITRNVKHFTSSRILAVSPEDFCKIWNQYK